VEPRTPARDREVILGVILAPLMLQCKISDILRRSNPSRGPDRWRYPMFWRDWARKDLQRDDLNALVELKRGWGVPSPARRERLGVRGFIEELDDHKLRVTMKGQPQAATHVARPHRPRLGSTRRSRASLALPRGGESTCRATDCSLRACAGGRE
jgi:hypothetical protein